MLTLSAERVLSGFPAGLLTAGYNMICHSKDKDLFRVQDEEKAAGLSPDLCVYISSLPDGREFFS